MAKMVRRASELPKWFELSKYSGAESLDATGWYEQLSVRNQLQLHIDLRTNCLDALLESVQATPIIDVRANDLLAVHFYGGPLPELKERNPLYSFGVHHATVRDLYWTEAGFDPGKKVDARNFFDQYHNGNWPGNSPFKFKSAEWMHGPIAKIASSKSRVLIKVNTELPDSVLVEQFKQLLQSMRDPKQELFFPTQSHRKPDFSSWIDFGVLPYLDLRIWASTNDVQISNRVMADAIFPPGDGGEEVVRKTTSKLAGDLTSDSFLTKLASLAAYEITEQNTA